MEATPVAFGLVAVIALFVLAMFSVVVGGVIIYAIAKSSWKPVLVLGAVLMMMVLPALVLGFVGVKRSAVATRSVATTSTSTFQEARPQPVDLSSIRTPSHTSLASVASPSSSTVPPVTAPRPWWEATENSSSDFDDITQSEIAIDILPDWAQQEELSEQNRKLVVVQSGQFATEELANTNALTEVREVVAKDYAASFSSTLDSAFPMHLVESAAVRKTVVLPIVRTAGENQFTVYRSYKQVELSDQVRNDIHQQWQKWIGPERRKKIVALLVMATGVAFVASLVLRFPFRRQSPPTQPHA
ncbi:hypothetical protein [Calycomorphotria hydatis]|uniref:Uncharacterized protein n=1 Tax=Calycomorphotria hydatis TaxID=2528027 RepID=A0A517T4P4_9PLAN|nr:hypothetical protein [Calycomorphotria hydatis]QDT63352.1 hypothetical protein V22_05730 [Calycomorphotria hydatis]